MSSLPADLQRFLFLVPWLSQHEDGVPVREVCERLGLTLAELHRLVERVSFVGTPDGTPDELVDLYVEGDRMFVALPQKFVRAPRFSPEEMLSLLVVLAPLRAAPVPGLAEEASALAERLRAFASRRAAELADEVEVRLRAEGELLEAPAHLAALEKAVRERRVCEVEYYTASRDALGTRALRPVALVERRGAWYVIGDDAKTFKVERVKRVDVTDARFEVPEDLDLEAYRRGELFAWERGEHAGPAYWVTVDVRGEMRRWPSSGGPRFRAWVRGERGKVVWHAPAAERDAMLDETRALLARYENAPQ